jgi:hypothetical protein
MFYHKEILIRLVTCFYHIKIIVITAYVYTGSLPVDG